MAVDKPTAHLQRELDVGLTSILIRAALARMLGWFARKAIILLIILLVGCKPDNNFIQRSVDESSLALKWTFESGAPINQVPLRVSNVVVVVPAGGPLIALNVETGKVSWKYDPPAGVWERSYAGYGKQVYVGVAGGRLAALDATTGEVDWEAELGIEVQSSPLVTDENLYVPTTFVGPGIENKHERRAKLYVLERNSGEEVWSFETGNYILQTPIVHGDTLYLGGNFLGNQAVDEGGHTRIYALDLPQHTIRWTYESEDGFPKRLFANDSAVTFIGYQDFVSGIDAVTGNLRWRRDTGNWVPSLTGEGNTVYFGSANTVVHAIDVSSGEVNWEYNIEHGTFNYVLGAPILIDNELYFLTQHGDIVALDIAEGSLLWEVSTEITARVGLRIAGGWIFIGDEDGIIWAYSDT
jgi:outer membrane protein assembly factor BamB